MPTMLRSAFLALVLTSGCAGPMGRAIDKYESTHYPEALEALEHQEADAADFAPDERARYCLYRGLSHLAVGNAKLATRWLGRARREVDADHTRLSAVDRSRLDSAWNSLGLMPGDATRID